jgi:hypothetical protein
MNCNCPNEVHASDMWQEFAGRYASFPSLLALQFVPVSQTNRGYILWSLQDVHKTNMSHN